MDILLQEAYTRKGVRINFPVCQLPPNGLEELWVSRRKFVTVCNEL